LEALDIRAAEWGALGIDWLSMKHGQSFLATIAQLAYLPELQIRLARELEFVEISVESPAEVVDLVVARGRNSPSVDCTRFGP
jgi:hypothetical protein